MKELLTLNIRNKYFSLIPRDLIGNQCGESESSSIIKIEVDTSSSFYDDILKADLFVRDKLKDDLFWWWKYKRIYSAIELSNARLFKMSVRKFYEPCGKDCGTVYDYSNLCDICKSGERQVSPLYTRKGNYLNNRDVASTIGNEIVVSKRFVEFVNNNLLHGFTFGPVYVGKRLSADIFQLMIQGCELDFSEKSVFGVKPFDYSEKYKRVSEPFIEEVYKCPKGDNLGANLLSEAYVKDCDNIDKYDFFISRQTIGFYRGLINQRHVLFCSPRMRKLIIDNKIRGFDFEIAHVV